MSLCQCVRWLLIFFRKRDPDDFFLSLMTCNNNIDRFQFIYRNDSFFVVYLDFSVPIYNLNGVHWWLEIRQPITFIWIWNKTSRPKDSFLLPHKHRQCLPCLDLDESKFAFEIWYRDKYTHKSSDIDEAFVLPSKADYDVLFVFLKIPYLGLVNENQINRLSPTGMLYFWFWKCNIFAWI